MIAPVQSSVQDTSPGNSSHKIVDYMAGLKDIKDFNKPVDKTELEKEAAVAVKAATAAKAASAASVASGAQAQPPAAPSSAVPAIAQPVLASPKAPSDNTLAKAGPPIAAAPSTTPVSREAPNFPREAVKAGIDEGTVHARMSIDASGNVTNVQIVEARPPRIFDRAVRETLGHWKFNGGADARSYDTEIEFRR